MSLTRAHRSGSDREPQHKSPQLVQLVHKILRVRSGEWRPRPVPFANHLTCSPSESFVRPVPPLEIHLGDKIKQFCKSDSGKRTGGLNLGIQRSCSVLTAL